MIKKEDTKLEKLFMRQAAFITFFNGAAGNKSYDSWLSSLGLSENTKNRMDKKLKKNIAKKANDNANKILELFKKKKQ